jgi:hypothetical protein
MTYSILSKQKHIFLVFALEKHESPYFRAYKQLEESGTVGKYAKERVGLTKDTEKQRGTRSENGIK